MELADLRDLYDFGTPQRVLQWSGADDPGHSAEHQSRWDAMSRAMSLAPMNLELTGLGFRKSEIKRLRRHLKETGDTLPVEAVSYSAAEVVSKVYSRAGPAVLQGVSAQMTGEAAANKGFVGLPAGEVGRVVPGVACVEIFTGKDGLLWVRNNPRLAQKAAVKTGEKMEEALAADEDDAATRARLGSEL